MRDLSGRYDKTFFAKCSALLTDEGMMLLQAITIADQRYDSARKSVDFIRRHIFPGSCIPSVASLSRGRRAGERPAAFHLEDIGPHYATTLRMWRKNLFGNLEGVRALGLSSTRRSLCSDGGR